MPQAQKLVYHPILGSRGIKKKKEKSMSLVLLNASHTVQNDPFVESQLASHDRLQGRMWCKFNHVTPENHGLSKPAHFTMWV